MSEAIQSHAVRSPPLCAPFGDHYRYNNRTEGTAVEGNESKASRRKRSSIFLSPKEQSETVNARKLGRASQSKSDKALTENMLKLIRQDTNSPRRKMLLRHHRSAVIKLETLRLFALVSVFCAISAPTLESWNSTLQGSAKPALARIDSLKILTVFSASMFSVCFYIIAATFKDVDAPLPPSTIKAHLQNLLRCRWSEGCSRSPLYGMNEDIPKFCSTHKQEHHRNLKVKLCMSPEGCQKQASFGSVNDKHPRFCHNHKLESHVFDNASFQTPIFGSILDLIPRFCIHHKLEDHVNLRSKRCEFNGCPKQPAFGDPVQKIARFCFDHKPQSNWVNIMARRCEHENCLSRPSYAASYNMTARFCSLHKPAGFVNMYVRHCSDESGCKRQASYGYVGSKTDLRCTKHKRDGMIHMWGLCKTKGCTKNASFGPVDGKGYRCSYGMN
ncbi:hypothetical protein GUITHDRAFT_110869 [Guillardia theta CCMP2712]|uniref:Uncharacterized protein n=1 Tax=Guillardia theta (strain CCMP2712) TaxID=905079 RepID=L1J480_GUITC|nr:hypothetical protein GUITHDRAFT_110869 [Guillardia theta CCMP2712]EKX43142.1 hypothetical protein GUITHDRAFT_110869 [Guillardia theta CCMP2712]|eukprot:XP_005830122.1 hypothetical protein GUITHDRAFT_110869 [Guillardia theta CCMP2712]